MSSVDDPEPTDAATAAAGAAETQATAVPARSADASIASAQTMVPSDLGAQALTPAHLIPVAHAMYERLDELARGGLGRISRARDLRTGRIVAIKEVLVNHEDAAIRFAREAIITATLQHPSIVPVYEVGRWSTGEPFYAMKLVAGRPFNHVIDAAPDLDARLGLVSHVLAVADALAYAHGERVIHRDLKPHNVLCGAFGETVVIDWGLARKLDEEDASPARHRRNSAVPGETHVGAIMGTPAYMPPEQARGKRVDERADVYAIGAILYHLLAGAPAYAGKTLEELITKVKTGPPRPIAELVPEVPPDLAAIVERSMAPDPEARYRTASELATDLRRFTTGQLVLAHRYTALQRARRFVVRHRGAVGVASIALVTLVVLGSVALAGVLHARDAARTAQQRAEVERARADHERDATQRELIAAHVDRARIELAAHPRTALAFVVAAAEVGGLDPTLRYLAARATEVMPRAHVLPSKLMSSLAVVPGSHDLIVGSERGLTRWNPELDRELWTIPSPTADVVAIDATELARATEHSVDILDTATGMVRRTIALPPAVHATGLLGFDRTLRWMVAVTATTLELVDAKAGTLAASIPFAKATLLPIVSSDGERIAVGVPAATGWDVTIVDRAGHVVRALCNHCGTLRRVGPGLAFAELRTGLASRIGFVDWSGSLQSELIPTSIADVIDIVRSPDGRQTVVVMEDGVIEVRELGKGLVWKTKISTRAFQATFDAHGRLWVLGTYDQTHVYDPATGVELARWAVGGGTMVVSDDGDYVAIGGSLEIEGVGITAWDAHPASVESIAPSTTRVRRVVFLDHDHVVFGSDDGGIDVAERGKPIRRLAKHDARIVSLQRTAEGALLSSSRDGTTVIRELGTGRELERYPLGPLAAVSSDGIHLAIGNVDQTVTLVDRKTKVSRVLAKLAHEIVAVRWSPDGSKLAVIEEDSQVTVWTADGTKLVDIAPDETGVDVVFSRDGRWIGRVAITTQAVLYSLVAGVKDLELEPKGVRQHSLAAAIAFSPNDQRVAISDEGRIRIWNVTTGVLERTLSTGTEVLAVVFSADGSLLYGGGIDRVVRVWDVAKGLAYAELATPSEIYGLVFDEPRDRLAIMTLGAAMLWSLPELTLDLPVLRQIANCANELDPVTGIAKRIDVVACNHLAGARRQ